MGLSVKAGQFAKNTTSGTQAITGLGFQPKLLFIEGTTRVANNSYGGAGSQGSFGVGTATEQINVVGTFSSATKQSTSYIFKSTIAATETVALTSLDADGFTLTLTSATATANLLNYFALGGSDLTNVKIVTKALPTGTGNQSITGVGFQPDAVIILGRMIVDDANNKGNMAVGFVKSTTERVNASLYGYVGSLGKYANTAKAISGLDNTGSVSKYYEGDLVSFDADGLTINWSTVTGSQAGTYAVVCLKGINISAGYITQPAATGNQAYSGFGFQPKGVLFAHTGATANDTVQASCAFGAGFSDGTTNCAMQAGTDNTSSYFITQSSCVRKSLGSATPTVLADASIASFDSDGFTLNWGTTDAATRIYPYMAFGASGSTPPPTPTNTGAFFSFL